MSGYGRQERPHQACSVSVLIPFEGSIAACKTSVASVLAMDDKSAVGTSARLWRMSYRQRTGTASERQEPKIGGVKAPSLALLVSTVHAAMAAAHDGLAGP